MSLIKNKTSTSQEELKQMQLQMLSLREQDRQDAEDKFQVALLIETMNQYCEISKVFMKGIENQLKEMNEKQLNLLNLQKEYESKVRGEALAIVRNTYASIKEKQGEFFDRVFGKFDRNATKLMGVVDKTTAKCNQSVNRVEETTEKLYKLKTWWDLIWYAAPISVLLNLIFRVYQYFSAAGAGG
jgi:hypothetical protein